VSWKRRAEAATDLKAIYQAATVNEAEQCLTQFEAKWHETYPPIAQSWRRRWIALSRSLSIRPKFDG